MELNLFKRLLRESESDALDFKSEQYKLSKSSKEEKAELIKDILAFTNAWRRETAYILIGVKDTKKGCAEVKGITELYDDNNFQQLLTEKTNRRVEFSYEVFDYEGKTVGILAIHSNHVPPI